MKKFYLLFLLMLLPLVASADVCALQNEEKEPYAVLSEDNTVLTFYYDDQKAARNGMGVGPFSYHPLWYPQRESITSVVFDDSFANCTTLTSTAYWFCKLKNLSYITGISNLKTDNVTNMNGMFNGCFGLTSLDVTGFKTDNVTDMGDMFRDCSSLKSLDVSGFKTGNVTSMCGMFEECSGLTSLDVTGFKTDNVTDMSFMFNRCSGLTNLDVTGLKTDYVTNMEAMFAVCSSLTSLDVTGFKTDNVTDMNAMFYKCSSLTSLDVTGFKTDNVTDMRTMFNGCSGLTSLDVTRFKTDNVTYMGGMFTGCSGLTSLDVTRFKTDNVTDMGGMFAGCSGLTSLDLTGFKTDNVEDMEGLFQACYGLTSLDLTGFKTDKVTNLKNMFHGCFGLTSLDLTGFTTDNVTDMSLMFYGCPGLKTIYAGDGWSTAKVTAGGDMFKGCSSLVGGAGTTYNATHADHTYAHIDGGTDNPGYFTDKNATPSTGGDPEPEPYAVLSEDNTVLTFYYDDQKTARNGMGVGPFTESYDKDGQRFNINSGWDEQRESITSVVFDESFANCTTLTSTACWFYGLQNLSSITGISNLKTDKVTDMCFMFRDCSGLTSLDVTGFKTDNVTNMRGLFEGCSSLTSLDVTGFKTDNVRNMSIMFSNCSGLTSLDVTGFKTDKVGVMRGMFNGCSGLTSLDVTGFKTDEVGDMGFMFSGCSGLTSLDLSNFKIDNVKYIDQMFCGCSGLTSLDVTGFKTDNVTDMIYMFRDCSGLTSLDVTGFKTDNVTRMCGMFYGCSSLTSLDVTGFKTDKVTDMSNMFRDCSSLTSLDVAGFRTDNVKDMYCMFQDCSGLKTIYAGEGWSTAEVTAGKDMFKGCTSLVGGTGTRYDESHTGYNYARIDGGASNPGYFTEKSTTDQEDVDEIIIKEIGKTTWCSKYDLDFTNVAGIKAYTATGYNNITKTIWLTRVMEVPAGTGILVKGDAGTYKIPHAEVQSAYANWFVGNLGETISISATDGDKTNYYLSGKDGSFVSVNGNANIGKNKAYLQLPTSVFGGTRSIGICYDDEDGTTSIKNLTPALTEGEGAWYTLQGQRVAKPGKGLYIHNGKKVVIK